MGIRGIDDPANGHLPNAISSQKCKILLADRLSFHRLWEQAWLHLDPTSALGLSDRPFPPSSA